MKTFSFGHSFELMNVYALGKIAANEGKKITEYPNNYNLNEREAWVLGWKETHGTRKWWKDS